MRTRPFDVVALKLSRTLVRDRMWSLGISDIHPVPEAFEQAGYSWPALYESSRQDLARIEAIVRSVRSRWKSYSWTPRHTQNQQEPIRAQWAVVAKWWRSMLGGSFQPFTLEPGNVDGEPSWTHSRPWRHLPVAYGFAISGDTSSPLFIDL